MPATEAGYGTPAPAKVVPLSQVLPLFAAAAGARWAPGLGLTQGWETPLAGAWRAAQAPRGEVAGYTADDFVRLGQAIGAGAVWRGRVAISGPDLALRLEQLLAEAQRWDGSPPARGSRRAAAQDRVTSDPDARGIWDGAAP